MTRAPEHPNRRALLVRLLALLGVVALGATLLATASSAEGDVSLTAVPGRTAAGVATGDVDPGAGARRGLQTGRAQKGYTCNTRRCRAHRPQRRLQGAPVRRPRRATSCAYYDSTLLSPRDVPYNAAPRAPAASCST